MSILAYNGITFENWLTLSYDQEAVYDDSDTDWMYDRITITGTAIITDGLDPAIPGEEPAATIPRIRQQFMQPREDISFTVNGKELMPGVRSGGTDAKNGPLPQYISLMQVTESSFIANIKIISHWVEAPPLVSPTSSQGGKILSHRWSQQTNINKDFYTRMMRRGKIVIASDGSQILDKLRETMVTTSINNGFVRISSEYIVQENGLAMAYSIVDQELWRLPPYPATEASGRYMESTAENGIRHGEMQLKLRGPKEPAAAPDKLLKDALLIVMTKLQAGGPIMTNKGSFLMSGTIKQDLYDNTVDISMRTRIHPLPARVKNVQMDLKRFKVELVGSDPGATFPPDPGTRGTALKFLHAAAYNDPTLAKSLNSTNNSLVGGGAGAVPSG